MSPAIVRSGFANNRIAIQHFSQRFQSCHGQRQKTCGGVTSFVIWLASSLRSSTAIFHRIIDTRNAVTRLTAACHVPPKHDRSAPRRVPVLLVEEESPGLLTVPPREAEPSDGGGVWPRAEDDNGEQDPSRSKLTTAVTTSRSAQIEGRTDGLRAPGGQGVAGSNPVVPTGILAVQRGGALCGPTPSGVLSD
ncbi:MAG: hypothetical protein QOI89_3468 [Solirubrobacteraceae bacterium]|jgi:hypothetical protein|nr:hypothetical protein [Solirubrobacteraceae bacterium]